MTKTIPNKECGTVLDTLEEVWLAHYTAPKAIISDVEGALNSDEARLWADRMGTEINLKPPGNIGASTVERHHELLRHHLHRCKGQAQLEGLPGITDITILREATLAKNVLLNTHGVSPYMALCDRQPNLLKDFENHCFRNQKVRDSIPRGQATRTCHSQFVGRHCS